MKNIIIRKDGICSNCKSPIKVPIDITPENLENQLCKTCLDENFRETNLNYYFIFGVTFGFLGILIFIFFSWVYQFIFIVFFGLLTPNDDNLATIMTGIVSILLLFGGLLLLLTGIIAGVLDSRREKKEKVLKGLTDSKCKSKNIPNLEKEKIMDSENDRGNIIPENRPKIISKGLSPKQWVELKEKGLSRSEAMDFINSGSSDIDSWKRENQN